MADISIRESIRWLPDAASEPTSTIVLTSPERRFVDIRILNPTTSSDQNLPLSRLDWAISGTSSSTPVTNPSIGQTYFHCIWRHWINSRTTDVLNAADEGDNHPVDGQPSLTLEKGSMINPSTGLLTQYEEFWRSEEIQSVEGKKICLVLEYQGEKGEEERGSMIRLGQYVQAFMRKGEDIIVERYRYDGVKGWVCEAAINEGGKLKVPSDFVMMVGGEAEVEDEVVGPGGERWKVVEKSVL
ncbi:hypothetical protein QBC38DRAFT_426283 [Podospora fimiseda]|uniref:Protein HRI1 n=1 Tax=Podospora fimiseda TaxID=252190 RepID=A0AAN6YTQ3_9PEZI|nr:hypothetical protein QBC38DRAFT_426283 [Podospora fimiseda]